MKFLTQCLMVGVGGFVGAIARYVIALFCGRLFGTGFPTGTFIINITGSFVLGWFLELISGRPLVSDHLRLAVAVGFVGAYTTFSTFMYESNSLLETGSELKALANLLGSLLLGLIAVRLGMWVGSR